MLTEKQKQTIIETMRPYHPTKIGVFKNDDRELGLLYSIDHPSGVDAVTLWNALEKILQKKIDFIDFDEIDAQHSFFQKEIIENQDIFYSNGREQSHSREAKNYSI
ncbi:MAG: hypothetical protein OXE77_07725 [Flavobacteriaceae bacterium]|nr:hypothetical protein [Flavobacteriaceae bacterium]MCY4266458.1 hypothetical protein [Flavobacteriaceae bacterium]MCY4297878.1 hypothetical protein [Flavobacteriaceae bacterium]